MPPGIGYGNMDGQYVPPSPEMLALQAILRRGRESQAAGQRPVLSPQEQALIQSQYTPAEAQPSGFWGNYAREFDDPMRAITQPLRTIRDAGFGGLNREIGAGADVLARLVSGGEAAVYGGDVAGGTGPTPPAPIAPAGSAAPWNAPQSLAGAQQMTFDPASGTFRQASPGQGINYFMGRGNDPAQNLARHQAALAQMRGTSGALQRQGVGVSREEQIRLNASDRRAAERQQEGARQEHIVGVRTEQAAKRAAQESTQKLQDYNAKLLVEAQVKEEVDRWRQSRVADDALVALTKKQRDQINTIKDPEKRKRMFAMYAMAVQEGKKNNESVLKINENFIDTVFRNAAKFDLT